MDEIKYIEGFFLEFKARLCLSFGFVLSYAMEVQKLSCQCNE